MKLTKYPQSCFLIETENKRILIDPGQYVEKETIKNFKKIDLLIYTHTHNDHCFIDYLRLILENNKPRIFCNREVADKLLGFKIDIVQEGDIQKVGNLKIEATKGVHGYIPSMKDSIPPLVTGFIIRDDRTSVYHCGDTLAFYHQYRADVILVPTCGFSIVMEPEVAVEFCLAVGNRLTIPMHYDSPKHPVKDTARFEKYAQEKGLNYTVLKNGESIEV